ncbi:MAG: SCO family protein [Candidatus Omnitrophica bacterium]|nr:SCO family protein [Candidatus Omnitrophota bacterium]
MFKDKRLQWAVGISIILAIIFAVYSFKEATNIRQLPMLGQAGSFVLTEANGQPFDSAQLYGKVWIANFFFTTCSDICPMMIKNMSSLSRTFEKVHGVKMVSFTVNPEIDTPEILAKYSETLNKGKANWFFLTGKREDITQIVVNQFKLGKADEPIFHSPNFALVDRAGFIRGYYDGTNTDEVNQLFKDASVLLKDRF